MMFDPGANWFLLALAALAVWEVVEVWHHGGIFADARSYLDVKSGFWATMLQCPFCTAVWAAGLVVAVLAVDLNAIPTDVWWGWSKWTLFAPATLFVYALAVARLANLGNDLTHRYCRTPNRGTPTPEEPEYANDDPRFPDPAAPPV